MKQKTIFIAAAAILLMMFAAAALFYQRGRDDAAVQTVSANGSVLVRAHSPTLGPDAAPVTIVEFFDPACETCKQFYPLVKQMMAANPDKIRLVLRYAPFHPGSDKVVALLEAARKQGKYWQTLEAVFASQAAWAPDHTAHVDLVWPQLKGVGLNLEQMQFDLTSPEIAAIIAQDLADAKTLNVKMTPEYFVNQTPLLNFGYEQLKQLVDNALKETAKR